jgi:hypothetical protein
MHAMIIMVMPLSLHRCCGATRGAMSRVQEGSGFGGGSQEGFSNLQASPGTNVVCSIAMTYPAQIMAGCVCTLTHLPTLQQQTSYHLMLPR